MNVSLLKNVQDKLKNPTTVQPQLGETETVRGLLQARSGKAAAPSSAPGQSSIQEKIAAAGTRGQLGQLQQQGALQAAQLGEREADISQRAEQQERSFYEQFKDQEATYSRQLNSVLNDFARGEKTLDNQRDIADLEQVGFIARLENEQYINNLQQEGQKLRLDNELDFKKQLAQTVFADQENLLRDQIAFDNIIAADDRAFTEELANMDINYAMEIAEAEARAESTRQKYEGIGDIVTGGLKGYKAYDDNKKKPPEQGAFKTKED